MIEALNLGLVLLLLAIAVWTLVARDTFAAVAGFVPYGMLLTLAWLALSAVDVAMTEAAIGAGLTGALLIGAASRLRPTEAAARAEKPGRATRVLAALLAAAVAAAIGACVLLLPEPAPTPGARGHAEHRLDRRRQSDHRGAAVLPRDGHAAGSGGAAVRAARRLVAGARPLLGRPAGRRAGGRTERHPGLSGAGAAADRHRGRHLHPVGRRRPSGRQVPGRHRAGRDVAAGADGRPARCARGRPPRAAAGAGGRARGVHRDRLPRRLVGGRLPRLSGRPGQAADPGDRDRADALAGGDAGAAAAGAAATGGSRHEPHHPLWPVRRGAGRASASTA